MAKPQQRRRSNRNGRMILYLLLVGAVAIVCFYPITRYYFLQDDFILLANAAFDRDAAVRDTFGGQSDLFRPLTKLFYFSVMYGTFGLNPVPYHVVSLIFHVLNGVLLFLLLRRFRIDRIASLVVTSFFMLHMGFFDVVAWISCIQQLAGQAFMLTGLILGIRAMETRSPLPTVLALLSYALALTSLEQTYALPVLLFLYAYSRDRAGTAPSRAVSALRDTGPYLVLMVGYLVYMAALKGVPQEGPYSYKLGTNVIVNLLTYLDWVFDISLVMPFVVDASRSGLTSAHVLLAVVVIYNLAKGRKRIVLFSAAYYMLTILPTLFLENHTFYLHNYVPSVGIALLIAPVVEDLLSAVRSWNRRLAPATALVLVGFAAIICFTKVRVDETNQLRPDLPLPKSFVLRRAVIAKQALDDLMAKTRDRRIPHNLFMISRSDDEWYTSNVINALGRGSALRLFYSRPDLNVTFHEMGDTLQTYDPETSQILFFDYMGRCYTPGEIGTGEESPVKLLESQ